MLFSGFSPCTSSQADTRVLRADTRVLRADMRVLRAGTREMRADMCKFRPIRKANKNKKEYSQFKKNKL